MVPRVPEVPIEKLFFADVGSYSQRWETNFLFRGFIACVAAGRARRARQQGDASRAYCLRLGRVSLCSDLQASSVPGAKPLMKGHRTNIASRLADQFGEEGPTNGCSLGRFGETKRRGREVD